MTARHGSRAAFTGYVLAGGRSSRMGQDKCLLELAGETLIKRAVKKLSGIAREVRILSSRPELAAYAPLVPDLRENCGPLGGLEAALADARSEWIMVLPVDMPFVPSALLQHWADKIMQRKEIRVALFAVDGRPQPALCLLHREMLPYLASAMERSMLKLYSAFEEAARELAALYQVPFDEVLSVMEWNDAAAAKFLKEIDDGASGGGLLSPSQRAAMPLWFANLNTPEEFERAVRSKDALENGGD